MSCFESIMRIRGKGGIYLSKIFFKAFLFMFYETKAEVNFDLGEGVSRVINLAYTFGIN